MHRTVLPALMASTMAQARDSSDLVQQEYDDVEHAEEGMEVGEDAAAAAVPQEKWEPEHLHVVEEAWV
jgi:hypothetical protein